jgi:hypothetical protein
VNSIFLGSTGNRPVPLGYQPSGMEEIVDQQACARLVNVRPTRSGRQVADRHRQVAYATLPLLALPLLIKFDLHLFTENSEERWRFTQLFLDKPF